MAVKLNQHDLEFVLKQIKIAEAHTAGTPLTDMIVQPHLPYGLRTVDGSYNNILPGRELWGAADQTMPRMFDPYWRNEADGDSFDVNGPAPGGSTTNNNYESSESVADLDPRLISNLIVDMTTNNPAAVEAWFANDLAVSAWEEAHPGMTPMRPGATITDPATQLLITDVDLASIPNIAPDEGLSAPFNGWMTFFGQFFDHGLDLISKGGAGTIYVPLQPDDPLYVEGGHTNFMVLTRATQFNGPGADGVLGTADDTTREQINTTTPFVDQNQTYTSHPSHQVFLREYELVDGKPLATGHMLDGVKGLPTWKDVKDQARDFLGIELTDKDVFNIPLIRTDLYGEFVRDANGMPQVIVGLGPDGIPNTDDDLLVSGNLADPITLRRFGEPEAAGDVMPIRTSHSFLDDIAHNAVPVITAEGVLVVDNVLVGGVDPAGNAVQFDALTGANTEYDNELLDSHFITGDGRGNENIGLTAVHHVFHSEHNRQVEAQKLEILKSNDMAFINEWLRVDLTQAEVAALPTDSAGLATIAQGLGWDGERLFQAARFATEMQYQHLVFEEFGRKVQPLIDLFVFNTSTDIDPAIFSEFANVVYRFGHSMLTEDISRMFLNDAGQPIRYDGEGNPVVVTDPLTTDNWNNDIGLIEAFLNPLEFDQNGSITHDQAAGAIFRGMTRVHGNEIDEFIVDALRNNLLGLPLDLAAINIARGRDTGMPTLNQAREQLYEATSSTFVKPYSSWADFAANLKTPASVINFIAAYGTHASMVAAGDDISDRRAAATLLVLGGEDAPTDRVEFLTSTGAWGASGLDGIAGNADDMETGINLIDLWIGGLAEKKMPFGGMLGSTFNAVFEAQMEMLQDFDRFYYLTRTQGLNLLNELENNAFSKMIMANTDMTMPGPDGVRGTADDIVNYHVGVDSFAKHDFVLHVDPTKQLGADPTHEDAALNAIGLTKVQRNDLTTSGPDANYIRFIGGEHVVIGGSEADDIIIADYGDDAIWGGGGNDRIEGGAGVDLIIGGSGDDIITDSGDTGDFIKGEDGDDVIANANGLDILMGGDGKDVFLVGVDATEVFAGEGDDFILGGADHDFLLGNEGDDWIEGGDGFDVLNGDNSELFFNSTIKGHDVLLAGENENDFDAESGDDIMVQGESVMRNEGMFGFDWAIHKGNRIAADSDMRIPIFTTVADDILRDRFDQTEGLSGWKHNDILRGDDRGDGEEIEVEFNMTNHELTQAGIDRIDGLRELLGNLVAEIPAGFAGDLESLIAYKAGNIILGGDGSDVMEGRGGDDFIHGDAWLNVRISVKSLDDEGNVTETEAFTVDSLKQIVTVGDETKPLSEFLLDGTIKPRQLQIVREVLYDEDPTGDVDTAVFAGNRDWYEITQLDGGIIKVTRREMEEIDPQVSEGSDTLVGIERIQFADQIVTIRQTGNVDPTGRLVISGTPATEGTPLTVSADQVRDLNNANGVVTNISYRWQVERNDGTGDYMNIPNVSGATFMPSDEHVGLRIRVLGTYIDGGGVIETVSSAPTDVVIGLNDDPVGPLLISDMTPTEGQELTATVAFIDPDGTTDAFEELLLTYQWQYSATASGPWTDVPVEQGGTTRSFTPNEAQVGQYIRIVVNYTDDLGFAHEVPSAVTALVGNRIVGVEGTVDGTAGDAEGGTAAGDDEVIGTEGDNTISGLGGADILLGLGGNDTLNGGDGADTLNGGAGDDVINGEGGDDIIIHAIGEGGATVDGGTGLDTLRIIDNSVSGNATAEITLTGGAITNAAGATMASIESAQLDLGAGNDTLTYAAATDSGVSVNLLAGLATGFSFIRGVENVNGSTHADTLLGNGLDNTMTGQGGDDTVRGGFGNDMLEGNDGNDRLYGEEGDDTLNGGEGDDRLDGGAGIDTVSYAGTTAAVTVTLASQEPQDTVGAGNDMLVSIENLVGSAQDDAFTGNAGNNLIDGGGGADTMAGGAGDDTYVVDDAGDVVTEGVGQGTDTVRTALSGYALAANVENLVLLDGATGGVGNGEDNELTGNANDNTLDGGGGIDTVVLDGHITDYDFAFAGGDVTVTSEAGGTDTLISIERIKVGGIVHTIAAGNNATNTGAGAVAGGAGADILLGFNGVDELIGNGGDDILIGGNAADTMVGGDGNDTYVIQQGTDFVNETGGSGIDTIYSSVTRNLNNAAHVTGVVENLTLVGTGNINGTGNGVDNIITGNAGNNTLAGGGGADTLIGNAGNDTLNGGAANDHLAGGDGDDTLNGQGGAGDVAVFAGTAGDYTFDVSSGGLAAVTDVVGLGGTDTLAAIERVQFGDGASMAILVDAPATDGTLLATEASLIFGGDGNDEIRGSDADDVIVGGAGDDNLFGSNLPEGDNAAAGAIDNDTFIWNVGDGSDAINGGFEGAGGDTLVVNGDEANEIYRIYTIDEAIARIAYEDGDVGGDFEAEIVVTRQVDGGEEVVIAAMTDIEEIVVDTADGTNSVEMFGDFSLTSLRPNTITVVGGSGDDTVDISSLLSAHRIVFKTGGGHDVIVGALRPQDVLELPSGTTIADYEVTIDETGQVNMVGDEHSISFTTTGGMPQFNSGDDWMSEDEDDGDTPPAGDGGDEDDDDDDTPPVDTGNDDDDDDDHDDCDDDDENHGTPGDNDSGSPTAPRMLIGTTAADILIGAAASDTLMGGAAGDVLAGEGGNDILRGEDGDDVLTGGDGDDTMSGGAGDDELHGGSGADMLFGNAGADMVYGDAGDDIIETGAGDDQVWGGGGDDIVLATVGDGNDRYWGEAGSDTLDYSAVGGNLTVDLGNGFMGRGQVVGNGGTDVIYGFENFIGGSGHDVITATNAVNVVDGGLGNDTFRFQSVAAVHGDTIYGFSPGDKIDFSAIDANATLDGKQSFSLSAGSTLTAAGQVAVSYDTRDGNEVTLVRGNVEGGPDAEFELTLMGRHNLTANDFNGVS